MKVGDTFFFDGKEFSIKNIEATSSEKFPNGRVDASRFVGSHDDSENPRTIQRGRPKGFELSVVAEILGETISTPNVESDIDTSDSAGTKWSELREADSSTIRNNLSSNKPKATFSTSEW